MTPGVFARTYAAQYPGDLFARIRADGFSAVQFNLSCAGLAALPEATHCGGAPTFGIDPSNGEVVTAFFPYDTYNERANRRWLAAAATGLALRFRPR